MPSAARHKRRKPQRFVFGEAVTEAASVAASAAVVASAESAAERYESVAKLNDNIKEQDTIIEYLEKVEKILSNMHWEIKNVIDMNKMEQY